MENYLLDVGLTYQDPLWIEDRYKDLVEYLNERPAITDTAENIMERERLSIMSTYDRALAAGDGIEILIENRSRTIDRSITHGYGHSQVGLYQGLVIKELNRVFTSRLAITRVELVQAMTEICTFIKRAIQLHMELPDVVKLYPIIIVTKMSMRTWEQRQGRQSRQGQEDQSLVYAYSIIMELAPGVPLSKIWKDLTVDESQLVADRIMQTIEGMADRGYGFSDFAMDNIMYDHSTGKITIIDIKPTDFDRKPRFLQDSVFNIWQQLQVQVQ
jgi:hypothetical protein